MLLRHLSRNALLRVWTFEARRTIRQNRVNLAAIVDVLKESQGYADVKMWNNIIKVLFRVTLKKTLSIKSRYFESRRPHQNTIFAPERSWWARKLVKSVFFYSLIAIVWVIYGMGGQSLRLREVVGLRIHCAPTVSSRFFTQLLWD